MSQTTTYTYTAFFDPHFSYTRTQNIISIARPLGNAPYTQTYTSTTLSGTVDGRVATQGDAYGNTTTLTYDPNQNRVTSDWPNGNTVVYQHYSFHSLPKSVTDATGQTITFTKNITEQLTSVTDRMGDTTSFTYHPQTGKIASITNNKGDVISYTYTAQTQTFTNPIAITETIPFTFYNLTRVDYPDSTYRTFVHDDRGNVTCPSSGTTRRPGPPVSGPARPRRTASPGA